jgi:hypothetical protein
VLKFPWQTFSNLIIVCCYDNEPTILNIDTACNKLMCKMANSIFQATKLSALKKMLNLVYRKLRDNSYFLDDQRRLLSYIFPRVKK